MRFIVQNETLIPEPLAPKELPHELKPIAQYEELPHKPQQPYHFSKELQNLLTGKALLLDEIPFPIELLHDHYLHGYVSYQKGIENGCCQRCGTSKLHLITKMQCSRCHHKCRYCRNCIMMGRVSECTPLITWTGPPPEQQYENILQWEGHLSPGQQEASDKLIKAIHKNTNLLVWAVCGAGKTEVLFAGIEEAITTGMRVCIASPRTDVIHELTPRLQRAFPEVPVVSLYGGSEQKWDYSPLTIATTHQLLRFRSAFDVMVIDEVDAFPFSMDAALKFAAAKAQKPESSTIYLTATPNRSLQQQANLGKLPYVRIPVRYHGHPLPVPVFKWGTDWQKKFSKGKIPLPLRKWTEQRLASKTQAFIFFPNIETMQKALPLFQKLNPSIESVHAEDPERKEKVQKMRNGEIPILLTTTILERGVTIPGLDVAVVGTDDPTFKEAALVQISGRVGRSASQPTGNITFFHFGRTYAMEKAKLHILKMNNEAKKRGWLKE
ncbi:DEAD/DEAH box helicase [Falsibacillus pallidus]|uniref:Competence protein ComFA n=1 Tax=Falsibacillus pallidus TaxID=493781 RepID=A0A370GAA4_9BACI|nr:DEAD/DEAH box helicase [Falsibacillus pallidus]RDI40130.1 competence protein ComFA [Falsibacillus pallidus]